MTADAGRRPSADLPRDDGRRIELAAELVNAGRGDLAEREARRLLALEPENGALHGLLSLALAQRHRDGDGASARVATLPRNVTAAVRPRPGRIHPNQCQKIT